MGISKSTPNRVQFLWDTTANWATNVASASPLVPALAELVAEQLVDGSVKIKVGDGVHNFSALKYTQQDATWHNLTLASGWHTFSGFEPAKYCIIGDIIFLSGSIENTTGTFGQVTVLTWPYNPSIAIKKSVLVDFNSSSVIPMNFQVNTSGFASLVTGGANTSLQLDLSCMFFKVQ